MFKGANTVGALPVVDEHPSWLPVDYAGRAIAEVVLRPTPPKSVVYHIVNPDVSASWTDILNGLEAGGLKFDRVERTEWLERLAASEKDPQKNPIIKLLVCAFNLLLFLDAVTEMFQPFFKNRYANAGRKPMVFLTEETGKVAPSISASPPVSADLVKKWVEHWRSIGFVV